MEDTLNTTLLAVVMAIVFLVKWLKAERRRQEAEEHKLRTLLALRQLRARFALEGAGVERENVALRRRLALRTVQGGRS